jgi:hypothetical protein
MIRTEEGASPQPSGSEEAGDSPIRLVTIVSVRHTPTEEMKRQLENDLPQGVRTSHYVTVNPESAGNLVDLLGYIGPPHEVYCILEPEPIINKAVRAGYHFAARTPQGYQQLAGPVVPALKPIVLPPMPDWQSKIMISERDAANRRLPAKPIDEQAAELRRRNEQ